MWSQLNTTKSSIIDCCRSEWQGLLDGSHPERAYHSFLAENAGLFFGHPAQTFFVLSELALGGEFVVDLVVPRDERSLGSTYELIELEIPSLNPYRKSGDPFSRFSHSLEQIQDWRTWLADHPDMRRCLFPSQSVTADSDRLNYTVITGRRHDDSQLMRKRNEWASRVGVKVRSFDYLTDKLGTRLFLDNASIRSVQGESLDATVCAQLANPFFTAWSTSQWRQISAWLQGPHAVALSARSLIENHRYSKFLGQYLQLP